MSDARDGLASIRWWPKDWRASKARAVLSLEGRAAYLELLFAQYVEPDCCLPDDDKTLAALAGVSAEVWERVKVEVLEWLPVVSPGKRQNSRMAHEWRQALAYREGCRRGGKNRASAMTKEGRSAAARNGAHARWASTDQASTKHSDARSMLADACTPTPTPTPASASEKGASPPSTPVVEMVEAWNRAIQGTPLKTARVVTKGSERERAILAALKAVPDLARWEAAFRALAASPHHRGENDLGWVADLDFCLQKRQRDKWLDAPQNGNGHVKAKAGFDPDIFMEP